MLIQQKQHNGRGAFYVEENGKTLAKMTYYFPDPQLMLIDHTEVDESLKGKKVGHQLVEQGVEFARTNHLRIVPECPFVKSVFEKDRQYDDVWK